MMGLGSGQRSAAVGWLWGVGVVVLGSKGLPCNFAVMRPEGPGASRPLLPRPGTSDLRQPKFLFYPAALKN